MIWGNKVSAAIIEVITSGILSFQIREDDAGNPWFWNLEINHSPAYLISTMCGTCGAVFERLGDVKLPLSSQSLSASFASGIEMVPPAMVETISALLQPGKYIVGLIDVRAKLLRNTPEDEQHPFDCMADYFWAKRIFEGKDDYKRNVYQDELILPLVPEQQIKPQRVREYEQAILRGAKPTVLALSVIYKTGIMGRYDSWTLAHFVIDGHHKIMAASNLGKPITILSFLSIDESLAETETDPFIRKHYRMDDDSFYE